MEKTKQESGVMMALGLERVEAGYQVVRTLSVDNVVTSKTVVYKPVQSRAEAMQGYMTATGTFLFDFNNKALGEK